MTSARNLLSLAYRQYSDLTFALRGKTGQPIAVSLSDGTRVFLHPAGQIARCLHNGVYENDLCEIFARCVHPGMTVVDIGANIGLYSLIASARMRGNGTVWAIEPSSETIARLRDNIVLNKFKNLSPVKLALSAQDDEQSVLLREEGQQDGERYLLPANGPAKPSADMETVTTLTLDTFCDRNQIVDIDVIKMDVEGGENSVFLGARKTLAKNPDVVIVFEHTREGCDRAGVTPRDIRDFLSAFGLNMYAWNPELKAWDLSHDQILAQGNAWACSSSSKLPSAPHN